MEIVREAARMQAIALDLERRGVTIGLVPTMGALHEGHLALVKHASEMAQHVVVSIFVNPLQFGPSEDLARYPRDLDGDCRKLAALGVEHVFAPDVADLYPASFQTEVRVGCLPGHLCGLTRQGHFAGVTTVVCKLFNLCRPSLAVFGRKDYQQLRVIEQMVEDLDMPVRIVAHPTVREPDGLAMSSRNAYLTAQDRLKAPMLQATLAWMRDAIAAGRRDGVGLEREGRSRLADAGFDVEYLSICDPATLDLVAEPAGAVLIAVAARLGGVRLIDNVIATPGGTPA